MAHGVKMHEMNKYSQDIHDVENGFVYNPMLGKKGEVVTACDKYVEIKRLMGVMVHELCVIEG